MAPSARRQQLRSKGEIQSSSRLPKLRLKLPVLSLLTWPTIQPRDHTAWLALLHDFHASPRHAPCHPRSTRHLRPWGTPESPSHSLSSTVSASSHAWHNARVLSHSSRVHALGVLLTHGTAAPQAPLSAGFSPVRILLWVAMPFPQGIFLTLGQTLRLRIAGGFLTAEPPREPAPREPSVAKFKSRTSEFREEKGLLLTQARRVWPMPKNPQVPWKVLTKHLKKMMGGVISSCTILWLTDAVQQGVVTGVTCQSSQSPGATCLRSPSS